MSILNFCRRRSVKSLPTPFNMTGERAHLSRRPGATESDSSLAFVSRKRDSNHPLKIGDANRFGESPAAIMVWASVERALSSKLTVAKCKLSMIQKMRRFLRHSPCRWRAEVEGSAGCFFEPLNRSANSYHEGRPLR